MNRIRKSSGLDINDKSVGHCYNGIGEECDYWSTLNNCSRCLLFGRDGISKEASRSLNICDKIYGVNYSGKV